MPLPKHQAQTMAGQGLQNTRSRKCDISCCPRQRRAKLRRKSEASAWPGSGAGSLGAASRQSMVFQNSVQVATSPREQPQERAKKLRSGIILLRARPGPCRRGLCKMHLCICPASQHAPHAYVPPCKGKESPGAAWATLVFVHSGHRHTFCQLSRGNRQGPKAVFCQI